ncbi:MAG TPA: PQQ-dependent sugar dehydrogenase [Candidatus Thermoplasmatota archaeon]|nr:PQQ-dependent sugar dehydrogenase [Candidatus Thermoplasmatota archaeon]
MRLSHRTVPAILVGLFLAASLAPAAAGPVVPTLSLERVGGSFSLPLLVTHADDGSGRVFVVEQRGLVRTLDGAVYLDLRAKVSQSGSERGLLGLAFAPDFETSRRAYVSYTNPAGASVLERLVGDPPAPNGQVLLTVGQPFSNHNGGHVAFGPDGYLYYALGDGGNAGDPHRNGQNTQTLLGSLLRLDVSGSGYAIPPDNPFVQGGGRAEIWAYGLRNPWRFSFDRASGDLWIADVGQNLIEEVNLQRAGAGGGQNYGWNAFEGSAPFPGGALPNPLGKTFPVLEYAHQPHCSVTGGHVYRGTEQPALEGWYVYADFCSGVVWGAREVAPDRHAAVQLLDTPHLVSSFGEDEAGELYLVHYGGAVYRVRAS